MCSEEKQIVVSVCAYSLVPLKRKKGFGESRKQLKQKLLRIKRVIIYEITNTRDKASKDFEHTKHIKDDSGKVLPMKML